MRGDVGEGDHGVCLFAAVRRDPSIPPSRVLRMTVVFGTGWRERVGRRDDSNAIIQVRPRATVGPDKIAPLPCNCTVEGPRREDCLYHITIYITLHYVIPFFF